MKFGVKLETYAIPEWMDRYVRYNELKKFLKRRKKKLDHFMAPSSPLTANLVSAGLFWRSREQPVDLASRTGVPLEDACLDFGHLLQKEVQKVESHYHFEAAFLEDRLDGIGSELDALDAPTGREGKKAKRARTAHLIRLQRAIVALWDSYEKLDAFVKLNEMAVYKILKKRDKTFGINRLNEEYMYYHQYVFRELKVSLQSERRMSALYSHARREEVGNDDLPVEGLVAAVQRHFMTQRHEGVTWVAFFLGASLILLCDILGAACLPATNPRYSTNAVAAMFPMYRLLMSIILLSWGAAVDVYIFENHGVNYKFLLDIDPRSELRSSNLFKLSAELTGCWILGFGLFFVDFKFGILGNHDFYWLHPLAQYAGQLTIVWRYQDQFTSVLKTLGTTLKCSAVLYPHLTLILNVSGDILTSMVKPLGDIEYMMCYYRNGLFSTEIARCSWDGWLLPVFTAFPFWIRFMQCLSRFAEGGPHRNNHLANMGKYFVSMAVVIATSLDWNALDISVYAKTLIWVFLYLVASCYSIVWDFVFDWGLVPDADNFLRSSDKMLYPEWMYYSIAMLNLFGRLTWALTLTPFNIVDDAVIAGVVIYTLVSAIEVVRRSAWIVIRLENEHLNNSSRYRAMLWVPRLDHEERLQDRLSARALVEERAANEKSWRKLADTEFRDSLVRGLMPAENADAHQTGRGSVRLKQQPRAQRSRGQTDVLCPSGYLRTDSSFKEAGVASSVSGGSGGPGLRHRANSVSYLSKSIQSLNSSGDAELAIRPTSRPQPGLRLCCRPSSDQVTPFPRLAIPAIQPGIPSPARTGLRGFHNSPSGQPALARRSSCGLTQKPQGNQPSSSSHRWGWGDYAQDMGLRAGQRVPRRAVDRTQPLRDASVLRQSDIALMPGRARVRDLASTSGRLESFTDQAELLNARELPCKWSAEYQSVRNNNLSDRDMHTAAISASSGVGGGDGTLGLPASDTPDLLNSSSMATLAPQASACLQTVSMCDDSRSNLVGKPSSAPIELLPASPPTAETCYCGISPSARTVQRARCQVAADVICVDVPVLPGAQRRLSAHRLVTLHPIPARPLPAQWH